MSPTLESVGLAIVDFYLRATVPLVVATCCCWRLRQPVRRLAVAWAALIGLVLLLGLAAIPGWPRTSVLTGLERRTGPVESATSGRLVTGPGPTAGRDVIPASRGPRSTTASPPPLMTLPAPVMAWNRPTAPTWPALVGGSFGIGATVMVGWLALGAWQMARVRRQAWQAPAWLLDRLTGLTGARSAPDLLISGRLWQPLALGIRRPTIILPVALLAEGRAADLDMALAHEWAHLRNRDLWLIALVRAVLPVLYAHPAYWWLRSQIRHDQEALADAAAAVGSGRLLYAETLLVWAQRLAGPGPAPLAAGGAVALFERPSELKRRIMLLLDRRFEVEVTCPARWRLATRAAMVGGVLGLSLVTTRPPAIGQDQPRPISPAGQPPTGSVGTARLLSPDGQPVAGAKVYRRNPAERGFKTNPAPTLTGTTGPDGSFTYARGGEGKENDNPDLAVVAAGTGPAFLNSAAKVAPDEVRLVRDDVPIEGRVLDHRGQPVAGATVRVVGILWSPTGTLDAFLTRLQQEKSAFSVQYELLKAWSGDRDPFSPTAMTDDAGRFTLRGIGRERIAVLLVSGPKIATDVRYAATRAMPPQRYPDFARQSSSHEVVYHGTPCDLTTQPDIEVAGTVTDQETGRPLAGVRVETAALFGNPSRTHNTTTDGEGRYQLAGIPATTHFGDGQQLLATSTQGPAYLPTIQPIESSDTTKPITIDPKLKRGVEVRGRVIDQVTAKGVRAQMEYFILAENPSLQTYPRYGTVRAGMPLQTDADGGFHLVVMPGPGILAARAGDERYRLGIGLETTGLRLKPNGAREVYDTEPFLIIPINYNTLVGIDPKAGDEAITRDVRLDPGRTVQGTIVDPAGQPLVGTRIAGLRDDMRRWTQESMPGPGFVVEGLGPVEARDLIVMHDDRKLAAAFVIPPDDPGPVTIRLQPSGTVTGRLVGADGRPLAGVQLTSARPIGDDSRQLGSFREPVRTDAAGRFRVEGLAPGRKYHFLAWHDGGKNGLRYSEVVGENDLVVISGESGDLGDLKVNKAP